MRKKRRAEYMRLWHKKNRRRVRSYMRRWRKKNRKHVRRYAKTFFKSAWMKAYRKKHRKRYNAYCARWRKVHRQELRGRYKGYRLSQCYGLTIEDFAIIKQYQKNRCALCGNRLQGGKGDHVDHSHDTGLIRGILCGNGGGCNQWLSVEREKRILSGKINYPDARRYLVDPPAVKALGKKIYAKVKE